MFYFGNTDYHVDESEGYVEVQVWRTGTDLSKAGSVTVRSRKTDPVSAEGTCRRTKSFPCFLASKFSKKQIAENNKFKLSPFFFWFL